MERKNFYHLFVIMATDDEQNRRRDNSEIISHSKKRYRIPIDEEVSKGRMHLIKHELDALIYFYPGGIYIFDNNYTFIIYYFFPFRLGM